MASGVEFIFASRSIFLEHNIDWWCKCYPGNNVTAGGRSTNKMVHYSDNFIFYKSSLMVFSLKLHCYHHQKEKKGKKSHKITITRLCQGCDLLCMFRYNLCIMLQLTTHKQSRRTVKRKVSFCYLIWAVVSTVCSLSFPFLLCQSHFV